MAIQRISHWQHICDFLCLLCLYSAVTIASPLDNGTPRGEVSSSSHDTRVAKSESRHGIERDTRIHSNEYGLISVSVYVEIEDYTTFPVTLPCDKKYSSCTAKNRDESTLKDAMVVSPKDDSSIVWTVSVEEIMVDGSDSISTPYSQRVFLEWNKAKEVTENGQHVTNTNTPDPETLNQNPTSFLGSANCKFMIPLKTEGKSLHPHPPSSSSASLARTFIVSLMESTQPAPDKDVTSLSFDGQNDRQLKLGNTNTVLTRRLAILPRKFQSRSQQTIDPFVDIVLYHSREVRYHGKTRFSKSSTFEDSCHVPEEDEPTSCRTSDKNDKESAGTSKKNKSFPDDENDFLWTLLILCTTHVIQSMPIQFVMKWLYHLGYVNSVTNVGAAVHAEHREVEDCQENTYDHIEPEEDIDKQGCNIKKKTYTSDSQFTGVEGQSDKVPIVPPVQVDHSCSERNVFPSDATNMADDRRDRTMMTRHSDNSCIRAFSDANNSIEDLQPQNCIPRIFDTSGKGLIKTPTTTIANRFRIGSNSDNHQPSLLNDRKIEMVSKEQPAKTKCLSHPTMQITKERQTSNNDAKGSNFVFARDGSGQKHPNYDIATESIEQTNNTNRSLKDAISTNNHPMNPIQHSMEESNGTKGRGIAVNSSPLDSNEKEGKRGMTDKSLPMISGTKMDGKLQSDIANDINHDAIRLSKKDIGSEVFQSISTTKSKVNGAEQAIREGDETEESYVSTLPPDSDYLSDEDPPLFNLSCSHQELSQSITNNSRTERERISTNARPRKRKKSSQCNAPPVAGDTSAGTNSLGKELVPLVEKEVEKETDLDSVEVVRVTIPDGEGKRVKRPYRKSNYVADWVPSHELQSMSQEFLREESWDIVVGSLPLQTSSNPRVVDESKLRRTQSNKKIL